jgi:2-dehydro-3-deoxygalactonokinase
MPGERRERHDRSPAQGRPGPVVGGRSEPEGRAMNRPSPRLFLSCDWGTSGFRLRLVDADTARLLAAVSSPDGVRAVHQAWRQAGAESDRSEHFSRIVRRQMERLAEVAGQPLHGLPLVVSGMASASIGWQEIPHQPLPMALDGSDLRLEVLNPPAAGLGPVVLVPGVRTADDVMRGEEIQIIGAAARGAAPDAWFILPGTHSKHVRIDRDRAVELRTYMTGEFFELLARCSILEHSIERRDVGGPGERDPAFAEGVAAGARENLLHASFGVRVADLDGRRSRTEGCHYLSGLLIGTELRELSAPAPTTIALVGEAMLTERYASALRLLGHTGPIAAWTAESAVIAGQLVVARRAGLLA